MTTEMLIGLVGAIAAILGAIIGGVFTISVPFLERSRKKIFYETRSMPLLRFKPLDNTLTITVDKSILSGNIQDKGSFEQVDNAYGFQIRLWNAGNEDIEKPNIEIQLDKSAKIISYEMQPSSRPGYEITIQKESQQPNILRILVPFINKKDEVLIRLISTNSSDRQCNVHVLGLGIKSRKYTDKSSSYRNIITTSSALLTLLLLALVTFLPASLLLQLGGTRSNVVSRINPPLWISVIFYCLLICLISPVLYDMYMRFRRKKRRKEWI